MPTLTGRSSLNSASLAAAHSSISPVRGLILLRHGEVEVLGNGQVVDVGVRLVRDPEAETARLGRRTAPAPSAPDLDIARVWCEEAAGDAQQGRFPGPVLPDESVRPRLRGSRSSRRGAPAPLRMPSTRRSAKERRGSRARESTSLRSSASSYGYILWSRLNGISEVADASSGYPFAHWSRFAWSCSWIGNTICGADLRALQLHQRSRERHANLRVAGRVVEVPAGSCSSSGRIAAHPDVVRAEREDGVERLPRGAIRRESALRHPEAVLVAPPLDVGVSRENARHDFLHLRRIQFVASVATTSMFGFSAGFSHFCQPSDNGLPGNPPRKAIFRDLTYLFITFAYALPSRHVSSPTTVR